MSVSIDEARRRIEAACQKVIADGGSIIDGVWGDYWREGDKCNVCPMGALIAAEGVWVVGLGEPRAIARALGVTPDAAQDFAAGFDRDSDEGADGEWYLLGREFRAKYIEGAIPSAILTDKTEEMDT